MAELRQPPATHTHGVHFGHVFGHGTQSRHRPEGFASEVHVQPGHDDALAVVGQPAAHVHQLLVEELRFVDAHHIGMHRSREDLGGRGHRLRIERTRIVRHHLLFAVARIDGRFENHHFLTRDARTLDSANQFFGFTGEHAAAYRFNTAFAREMFVVGHDGKDD